MIYTQVMNSWKKNPSRWGPRLLVCFFATIAVIIATYMGLYQLRIIHSAWDPIFGSGTMQVLDSAVSHDITRMVRVPDAILGVIAYLGDIIFALAGSTQRWYDRPWLVFIFAIDVILLGVVSAILVSLQGFSVGSWCFLCLCSATISLILVVLAIDEVRACFIFLWRVWKRGKNFRIFWNTFWGNASSLAYEVAKEMAVNRGWRK